MTSSHRVAGRPIRWAPICAACLATAGTVSLAAQRQPNPAFATLTARISAELSGGRAFATTRYVQQFFRWPGNRGFDASIDTVIALLRTAGYVPQDSAGPADRLTYRVELRPLRGRAWTPRAASITLDGDPVPLEQFSSNLNMLPINAWGTPPGGIDAEIVNASDGSDSALDAIGVRGRIVYVEDPDRAAGGGRGRRGGGGESLQRRAAQRGAVGVLLGQELPDFNRQQVNRAAIQFRSVPYDTSARIVTMFVSLAARDRLNAALRAGPVHAHLLSDVLFESRPERTIVAEVRGSVAPTERMVYSAHVQEPGANDNATGVGTLAEMARVVANLLHRHLIDPGRTITMLWGNEIEQTRNFVAESPAQRGAIKWGMSLDMVGENTAKTGGTFLIEKMPDPSAVWVRGEDQHTEWDRSGKGISPDRIWPYWYNDFVKQRCVDQSTATGGTWVVKANPFEGGSDHVPFLTAHIPAVLLWHFTDQFYHTDPDRIDKVSAPEMQHVGNCALAVGLILTAHDHPEYARATVAELADIAARRLAAEGDLSKAALRANPGDSTLQRTIIDAWRDYYVTALTHVPDMTLPHLELTPEIARAQQTVRAAAQRVEAMLTAALRAHSASPSDATTSPDGR